MKLSLPLGCGAPAKLLRKRSKGFTLVEMITAMTIIAVVLTIAAPMVGEYLRSVALKDAVYKVVGDLNVIKSQAIKTQVGCQINFDNANHQYTLSNPNRTMDLTAYRGNVRFTVNPAGADDFSLVIGISPRGISDLVPPATTQVYLTNQDNRIFRIETSAAGAVTFREFNSATNSWI